MEYGFLQLRTEEIVKYFAATNQESKVRWRRRSEILDATHAVLSHIGYEQMTMDGVAQHAGVSKPTLYAYFSGKEELSVAAVGRQMDRAIETLSEFDRTLSPQSSIEAFARWAVSVRFLDGDALLGVALRHILDRDDYTASHQALLDGFRAILDRGKASGVVEPTQDTLVAARLILSAIREFSLRERSPDNVADYERETDSFIGLLRNAVFLPVPPIK